MADERRCEACGRALPLSARPDRRHCDQNCRHKALRRRRREQRVAAVAPESPTVASRLEAALEQAVAEPHLLAVVARAAQDPAQWRAAAWVLERRHPERWGARRRDEPPAVIVGADPSDPFLELDELAERRRRRRPD